jgi:hypothetical protein
MRPMTSDPAFHPVREATTRASIDWLAPACVVGSLILAPLASSQATTASKMAASATEPSPDPRPNLKAGWLDPGQASWNMRVVSANRPSDVFFSPKGPAEILWNSDLAFTAHYAVQGNYSGFQIWDIANPQAPRVVTAYVCRGGQSDPSVYGKLLFLSVEENAGRKDCGLQGVTDTVSTDRFRGIRVFDISDIEHPKLVTNLQTCRGSHTNTVIPDPHDNGTVYVYVSAVADVRSPSELQGCAEGPPDQDSTSQRFRIDVIKVPLADPTQAKVVNKPALLAGLEPIVRHADNASDLADTSAAERGVAALTRGDPAGQRARRLSPLGPIVTTCHDITVYPAIGMAGAACIGYGLLLDVRDPVHPRRLAIASDTNFFAWHSATFSNDGTKLMFTDEWGGGGLPRCRATDNRHWGADAIYTIDGDHLTFDGYYKRPSSEPATKNCVAHNGSLVPIPGRNIMVQSWLQGGVSVFDWTDPTHAQEIAYFDRGPVDSTKLTFGGTWSAYWYNGYIYSSEAARGFDVLELSPSALLTQNEIDAAKTVHFEILNVQDQPQLVWPPSFALARAYVDQLARDNGLASERRAAVTRSLDAAEKRGAGAGRQQLATLATQLDGEAASAGDPTKVKMLADAVRKLSTM